VVCVCVCVCVLCVCVVCVLCVVCVCASVWVMSCMYTTYLCLTPSMQHRRTHDMRWVLVIVQPFPLSSLMGFFFFFFFLGERVWECSVAL